MLMEIPSQALFEDLSKISVFVFCILFLLHPIDNTLVVQYQLVQG